MSCWKKPVEKKGAEYPGAPGTKKGQEHGGASKTDEANRTGRPEQLPELEKQAVKAANQAQSQVNQTEAVGHMVRDQMLQNKEPSPAVLHRRYGRRHRKPKAFRRRFWPGLRPDSNDPERRAADLELAARVGKSPTLMEVARYLGRLKELMDGKRKNGYAYAAARSTAWSWAATSTGPLPRSSPCLPRRRRCRFSCASSSERHSSSTSAGSHLQGKRRHHLYAGRVQFCGEPSTLV